MANCHDLFLEYNGNLNVTKGKKDNLKKSKDALRKKIRTYFAENHSDYVPHFFIQGSYKMGTMIRTKDDECDLDDGVYFLLKPNVNGTTLQKWVYNAVEGHTTGGQQHRTKCIRVVYSKDYHIDLPVYYRIEDEEHENHPFLAVKDEDWQESDPKEFLQWYNDNKTELIVRIARYLKGWGDYKRNNMPSGLAMAVLAEKNIQSDKRDDITLRDTLKAIKKSLNKKWVCEMPTTPKDDLFDKYDNTFKDNFFKALDAFIEDADSAILEDCPKKASRLWKKHLGGRFPLGETIEEQASAIGAAEKAGSLFIGVKGRPDTNRLNAKSKGGVFGT